jgi:type 2A phosphatase activator TIP41
MTTTSTTQQPAEFDIGEWHIETNQAPILSAPEIDAATARLGLPMPEMIFGNNYALLRHTRTGFEMRFDTLAALDLVDKTGERDGLVQVSYSKAWQKSRESTAASNPDEVIQGIVKPFDWTYTTAYKGESSHELTQAPVETPQALNSSNTEAVHNAAAQENDGDANSSEFEIPFDRLRRPDPILFYKELSLYEDELGDNGIVSYTIKLRVMPARLLLLARFFLRVDNVLFRIRDTRVFIEFSQNLVLREYQEREDDYKNVYRKIPRVTKDFGQWLRDENWVCSKIRPKKIIRERIVLRSAPAPMAAESTATSQS